MPANHDRSPDEIRALNERLRRLHLARETFKLEAASDRMQRRINDVLFSRAAGDCWNRLDELGVLPDPTDHEPGHA